MTNTTEPDTDWTDDLREYFPLEAKNQIENEYFQKHLDSYITNQNINNDYAILALHRLFMFCAYGLVYAVIKDKPSVLKNAFILAPLRSKEERRQLQNIDSLFTLSLLNESTFFETFSLAGAPVDINMKPLKELVGARNAVAHCNGSTVIDFDGDIDNYIRGFKIMNEKFANQFTAIIMRANSFDYGIDQDIQIEQLRLLLGDHYISHKMLDLAYPLAKKSGLNKKASKLISLYLSDL